MAKDISEELYAKIKESFDRKYEKAQLLGEPLHDVFARIKSGSANFRDADMFAVEVGSMLSDSMKEHMKLDSLPNQTLYRNIAKKTIGEGLKDSYGIVSNVASVIQEEMNLAAGVGLKAVKPKLDVKAVDGIVDKAVAAKSQEELDSVLTEPVKTFPRKVADDTAKANARLHNKAGMKVKVEREYDGVGLHNGTDACEWCIERAGTWTYDKAMDNGVFERHDGCGCIITYTSKKGEVTRQTDWREKENWHTNKWNQIDNHITEQKRVNNLELHIDRNILSRSRQYKSVEELKLHSKSSILSAETHEEVINYFKDRHNILILGFDKKSIEEVKITLAGYDDLINEFPEAANRIKSITYNSHLKDYGKMGSDGRSLVGPKGIGDYGTGLHEAAHAFDFELSDVGTNSFSENIVLNARKKLRLRENSKKYSDLVTTTTGMIGERRSEEIFAFAIETEMGGLSNDLTKVIFELAKNR